MKGKLIKLTDLEFISQGNYAYYETEVETPVETILGTSAYFVDKESGKPQVWVKVGEEYDFTIEKKDKKAPWDKRIIFKKPEKPKETRSSFKLEGQTHQLPKDPYEAALIVCQSTLSSVLQFCGMLSPAERAKDENDPITKTAEAVDDIYAMAKRISEGKSAKEEKK